MRIVACIKATPDDADITVGADRSLDFSRAQAKIGAYDLNAIEAARQLADQVGAEVVGVTVGAAAWENTKLRKDALSRGLDSLVIVTAEADADTFQTATALAEAITGLGECDLVLLGAGSSDRYAQQVGGIRVERLLEDAEQVLEVQLPAVLSLTSGANVPRIAGMKDILAAGKKPVSETGSAPVAATARTISLLAPEQVDRRRQIVEGDPAETAAQLAQFLKSL